VFVGDAVGNDAVELLGASVGVGVGVYGVGVGWCVG